MPLRFTPLSSTYAVIRIDPVGSTEGLDYPDLQEAARNLHTKRYVVYLRMRLVLPTPDKSWIPHEGMPVAPSLRPEDEEHRVTSDMCTPISPNTDHSTGREPLETTPQFPYRSCYHWSDGDRRMDVRVRSGPEKFDDDVAVHITRSCTSPAVGIHGRRLWSHGEGARAAQGASFSTAELCDGGEHR
ncbi:hypothetical protein C8T65DRAFT_817154 [Cerioporus squamosus]|nr:hypothetical protein C8T65DRAFT_817154 [Cerioporus squamosus]